MSEAWLSPWEKCPLGHSELTCIYQPGKQLYVTAAADIPTVARASDTDYSLPSTDGRAGGEVQQDLKGNAEEKVAADDGVNWDKWMPYLLFAYQEVPQDSTGFSPFELLYGRAVRGPLDILKESWKEPKKCSDNVVSYVLAMQDKLATMAKMFKGNLERAQQKQKLWN